MNSRERVIAILNRKRVDRIPVDIWYTPEIRELLKSHFNVEDDLSVYRALGVDKIVWVFPQYLPNAENRGAWGTVVKEINTGVAVYQESSGAVLAGYETPESIEDFPYWPDPDKFDYDAAVKLAKQASQDFTTIGPWVAFLEIHCLMRGMEQAMMDMVSQPSLTNAILDKVEACQTEMMKRFFDRASQYIDMLFLSDDMGCQQNLLISVDLWDKYFKDRMKRWCDFAHSYGLKVFYHSDGAMEPLIGRLIESGIDVLNPIQHVCPGMDMAELKRKYGDQLIFHGGVENQSVLPFGTPEQVREETLNCLRTLGKGKEGYICCSCHNIQAGTPLENIFAMIETVVSKGSV